MIWDEKRDNYKEENLNDTKHQRHSIISVVQASSSLLQIEKYLQSKLPMSKRVFRDEKPISHWEWSSIKYHQMLVGCCNHDNLRKISLKQTFYNYSFLTLLKRILVNILVVLSILVIKIVSLFWLLASMGRGLWDFVSRGMIVLATYWYLHLSGYSTRLIAEMYCSAVLIAAVSWATAGLSAARSWGNSLVCAETWGM